MDDADDFDLRKVVLVFRPGRFLLGEIVFAPAAAEWLSLGDITQALNRHARCDWGDLKGHDWRANTDAVEHGGRILSAYHAESGERFWVITEANRSVTTVLFADEY